MIKIDDWYSSCLCAATRGVSYRCNNTCYQGVLNNEFNINETYVHKSSRLQLYQSIDSMVSVTVKPGKRASQTALNLDRLGPNPNKKSLRLQHQYSATTQDWEYLQKLHLEGYE